MSYMHDKKTNSITLSKGDTYAYYVRLTKRSGNEFNDGDVAIFTVKQGNTVKMEREFPLYETNGRILISFRNSDTDTWSSGVYNHGIKVVLNPRRVDGKVVDGDVVREITKSRGTLTIGDVMKEV